MRSIVKLSLQFLYGEMEVLRSVDNCRGPSHYSIIEVLYNYSNIIPRSHTRAIDCYLILEESNPVRKTHDIHVLVFCTFWSPLMNGGLRCRGSVRHLSTQVEMFSRS
jgi:hypothetical protein